MTRTLGISMVALLLALGAVACGDDDEGTVASDETSSTTSIAMDDDGDHMTPTANPCAPGESGTLPGMQGDQPAPGATEVTITATEYEFTGADALSAGGAFAISLKNVGKELHELAIVKLADDETRPLDQVLADDDAESKAVDVAATFACPGSTSNAVGADLSSPGRYVLACFIPTGATPETDPAQFEHLGQPHATQGMVFEVDVT